MIYMGAANSFLCVCVGGQDCGRSPSFFSCVEIKCHPLKPAGLAFLGCSCK